MPQRFVVLLDLSAAFDTVDHSIMLRRLDSRFHVKGVVHQWMHSYLSGWSSRVIIDGELSDPWPLQYGVPQGSVLGPILFSTYIAPISDIIKSHQIHYILYADDIQLVAVYDSNSPDNVQEVLSRLSACIVDISAWMSTNFLKLNSAKTEFVAFGRSASSLNLTSNLHLTIGDKIIPLSPKIMNLGVCMDSTLRLTPHVDYIVRTCNFHLRNLWRIRRFIDNKTCHHAVRALIISRLDYCNSLFTLLLGKDIKRLKSIQNRAARLVFNVGRATPTMPLLRELHWLPIPQRIQFKLCLHIHKIITSSAPEHLSNCISLYKPSRTLRSSQDTTRLQIPRSNYSFSANRFGVTAPKAWNNIPQHIREMTSTPLFKQHLKTYLFPNC